MSSFKVSSAIQTWTSYAGHSKLLVESSVQFTGDGEKRHAEIRLWGGENKFSLDSERLDDLILMLREAQEWIEDQLNPPTLDLTKEGSGDEEDSVEV